MTFLTALWLPILVSAVFVFVLSSLVHMVLPWHKNDYPRLTNEAAVMDALRPLGIPRGEYMVPRPASREDMKSPEFAEKMKRGPVFILNILPSDMGNMGKTFVWWFVYLIVVSWFAGHIAWSAGMARGDDHRIFHTVGLSAFMGYSFALWQMTIWYRRSWTITLKATIDGLLYAAVTALTFVWLWPMA